MIKHFFTALLVLILSTSSMAFAEGKSAKININTASAKTLDKELKYVGETIAKRIVEYRRKHGNFSSIEELSNVRGIGKKVVEANKKNVVVQ
ncbi:MAG: hypothetical protein B0D91_09235 [Oceanospirillales bacterium LUC14_002_19_P2]|nr:MAG: hypothetical protein B0D91_09235 [Oceanospirillales bacterium LUC14_002_19_P2]